MKFILLMIELISCSEWRNEWVIAVAMSQSTQSFILFHPFRSLIVEMSDWKERMKRETINWKRNEMSYIQKSTKMKIKNECSATHAGAEWIT